MSVGADRGGATRRRRRRGGRSFAAAVPLVLLLLALPAAAIPIHPGGVAYGHRVWGEALDSVFRDVRAAAPAADGRIWVGSGSGLFLFDGNQAERIGTVATGAILPDRPGEVWAGTSDGLVEIRGTRVRQHPFPIREGDRSVLSLSRGRDGSIWVVTFRELFRFRNGRFEEVQWAGPPEVGFCCLHEEADGRLDVGTSRGLFEVEKGRARLVRLAPPGAGADPGAEVAVTAIAEGTDGSLLVGGAGGLAVRSRGAASEAFRLFPAPPIRAIVVDEAEGILLATHGRGVWKVGPDGAPRPFAPAEAIRGEIVRALFRDREGSLWAAITSGGLHQYQPNSFRAVSAVDGLPVDLVCSLLEEPDGTLWIGTSGAGLLRGRSDDPASARPVPGLEGASVPSLARDAAGTIWIGTRDEGLWRWREGKLEQLLDGRTDGPASGELLVSEARPTGAWVASRRGVFRVDERGDIVRAEASDGVPLVGITATTTASDGALWIGTASGELRVVARGESLARPIAHDGGPLGPIHQLVPDRDGAVLVLPGQGGPWRATAAGLWPILPDGGLTAETMMAAAEDRRGDLWLLGREGCRRIPAARWRPGPGSPEAGGPLELFGLVDGFRSLEAISPGQPAAARLRDGRIAFATYRGLALVDPAAQRPHRPPLQVELEEIRVDGQPVATTGSARLSAGRKRLEFRWVARTFLAPESVRYRYRIAGLGGDWIDAGEARTATWPSLGPGNWLFEVEATRGADRESRGWASFAVSIPPRLHERPWFPWAAALALALAAAGAQQLRLRRERRRLKELEWLVSERTRALEAAGERLTRADSEIARLSAPGAGVLEETERWATVAATEVARAIGATRVGVFALGSEGFEPVGAGAAPPPELDELRNQAVPTERTAASGELLLPVLGLSGEPRGALVIEGGSGTLGEAERRLVAAFARHLGSALELRVLRVRLTEAETRRGDARRQMHERGIETTGICSRCGRCEPAGIGFCPTDGQPLDETLLPFRVAGRYRLLARLGEGGMGTVYRAADERHGREVALKIVASGRLDDPAARFRLEREANTIARIHHPGVVALHDTGELEDGAVFLVMEMLVGRDLEAVIRRWGAGTPRQVASLLRQASAALAAAHRVGVVHRDVKPANVYLVPAAGGFGVKILDFGLAKLSGREGRLTHTGWVVGTPAYMSPEQVQGRPVDERSDLYSLAAVLFEALTKVPVVASLEVAQIFVEIAHASAPTLSSFFPAATPALDAAFRRALAKDPDERPASLETWAAEVIVLLTALPEPPSGGWPRSIADWEAPDRAATERERTRRLGARPGTA